MYVIDREAVYFNDEPVSDDGLLEETLDGNIIASFRKTEMISIGDLISSDVDPVIDRKAGAASRPYSSPANKARSTCVCWRRMAPAGMLNDSGLCASG